MKRVLYPAGAGALSGKFIVSVMMLVVLWCVSISRVHAAGSQLTDRMRIYSRELGADSLVLFADNQLSVPVSVKVNLVARNLMGDHDSSLVAVIPPKACEYRLTTYRKNVAAANYSLRYNWKVVLGDATAAPETGFAYQVPLAAETRYRISQGPDGSFSHHHMFAYDFEVPVGTPVLAARDGIIAMIKTDSSVGGPDRKFIEEANFIAIYQSDGTIANYFHLNTGGAAVKEGQHVKKGEVIGYSGNTGFTSGAHLHFEVVRPGLDTDSNSYITFHWEEPSTNLASIHKPQAAN